MQSGLPDVPDAMCFRLTAHLPPVLDADKLASSDDGEDVTTERPDAQEGHATGESRVSSILGSADQVQATVMAASRHTSRPTSPLRTPKDGKVVDSLLIQTGNLVSTRKSNRTIQTSPSW